MAASSLKLVFEIALFALLGRWVLGMLIGAKRDGNLFYQMLNQIIQPFEKLVRVISPKVVVDQHIPLATGALLFSGWCFALLWKGSLMGVITT